MPQIELKRSISLPLLTLYGIGTILGAGIYVLVGKVAGESGLFAPVAFVVASIVAAFTGLSYAELSSRYPKSAGEAYYAQQAFNWKALSRFLGWAIVLTGVVSSATLASGFVGYFQSFVQQEAWVIISVLVIGLGLLAAWGIQESLIVAAVVTLLEIVGLIIVIFYARDALAELPNRYHELLPPLEWRAWQGIFMGSFLAFYAFIGFEDMVNVAEEVKQPRRNLPLAIIIALGITGALYLLVALVSVLALPIVELAASDAPMALVVEKTAGGSATSIRIISLVAIVNGALIQIIMASRVLYGMGSQGLAPKSFAIVHSVTRTPLLSTLLITIAILVMALGFPLVALAKATSFIILIVFSFVNVSLCMIKSRHVCPDGAVEFPMLVPIIGAILSVALVVLQGSSLL